MKRIAILFAVILVIVLAWTGAWFYGASLIRQNVTELASADGETTPRVTCERLDVGGWPFWFDVTCTQPTLANGDLTFSAADIKATAEAFDPFQIVASVTGPLTVEDAFTGSRRRVDWSDLKASGRLANWRIARISVVADGLSLADTTGGDDPVAKADHAEAHLLDVPEQYDATRHLATLRGYLKLDHLAAPGLQVAALDSTLDATANGLPDDIRTWGARNLLSDWEAAGGKLTVNSFKGADEERNFSVTGNLALDGTGKPNGQFNITSKGLVERFGALVPEQFRGLILGQPAADGSYSQSINIAEGVILAGLVPVTTIPALF